MKNISQAALGVIAVLGFIATPALAQQAGHGSMTAEQHRQMMASDTKAPKITQATGVVKAVDRAKGTATIAHNPIAAKKCKTEPVARPSSAKPAAPKISHLEREVIPLPLPPQPRMAAVAEGGFTGTNAVEVELLIVPKSLFFRLTN